MMMRDIEVEGATPEAFLAQAKADVGPLKAALSRAETALAKATQERSRLRSLYGRTQSRAQTLSQRMKREKLAALEGAAMERHDDASWNAYRKSRRESEECLASLQYIVSWAQPAADVAALEAEIEERERCADVLENDSVKQRLAMAVASAAALEYDPGVSLALENSWSAQQMATVARIRSRDLPDLRAQLAALLKTTANEQAEVSVNLFA